MDQRSIHRGTVRILGGFISAAWVTATLVDVSAGAAAGAAQKTVNDGIYTAAQADRGEALFKTQCESCHTPRDLASDEFVTKWTGKPLFELYDLVHATMPMDNPGSLKPEQAADALAHILRLNRFPAGEEELTTAPEALKAVKFEKKP